MQVRIGDDLTVRKFIRLLKGRGSSSGAHYIDLDVMCKSGHKLYLKRM